MKAEIDEVSDTFPIYQDTVQWRYTVEATHSTLWCTVLNGHEACGHLNTHKSDCIQSLVARKCNDSGTYNVSFILFLPKCA